jgi:hypothetical protein
MIRHYRYYWSELSVGFYPADQTAPVDWQDIMLKLDAVPHGGTVRVFEILVRDPLRSFGRWCSAQVQPSAVLLRHEVEVSPPDGVEWSDEETQEAQTWAEDLANELNRDDAETWALYGPRFFVRLPFVEVEIEVDDDDVENIDADVIDGDVDEAIEKLFEQRLRAYAPENRPADRPAAPAAAKE